MEQGDLAASIQPRLVLVLEGVLADVTETVHGRWRKTKTISYKWLPTPIKRLVYLKTQWPDTSIEVITFISPEAAAEAAQFFYNANVPVSLVSYRPLDQWVQEILWQPDIQTIYDSDVERIMRFGQRGYIVQRGEDF